MLASQGFLNLLQTYKESRLNLLDNRLRREERCKASYQTNQVVIHSISQNGTILAEYLVQSVT